MVKKSILKDRDGSCTICTLLQGTNRKEIDAIFDKEGIPNTTIRRIMIHKRYFPVLKDKKNVKDTFEKAFKFAFVTNPFSR